MPARPTLPLGHPLLRGRCTEVPDATAPDIGALATDLADTLADWVRSTGYGRGIAAPQIAVPLRVIHLAYDRPTVLINPVIVGRSDTTWEVWDTCLSFSVEIFGKVRRASWVDVGYVSESGRWNTLRAEGELGELLQHEIDHLDGILAVDRLISTTTLCMRSEFERAHRHESPYRP